MHTALVLLLPFVCSGLVALILMQHGKGADAGAAFGSGASSTVFGARGSANFLSRTTAWLAAAFFLLTLALGYLVHDRAISHSVMDRVAPAPLPLTFPKESPAPTAAPAAPAAGAPQGVPARAGATPAAPTGGAAPAPAAPKAP